MRVNSPARLGRPGGDAAPPDLSMFPADSYDIAALLDVLAHRRRQGVAWRAIFTRLKPGGALVLTVPANPWMWSATMSRTIITAVTAREIEALAKEAGYEIELLSPFNSLLFPLIAGVRAIGKLRGHEAADDAMPPKPVNAILDRLFGAEARAYRAVSMPFRRVAGGGTSPSCLLRAASLRRCAPRPPRDPRARDRCRSTSHRYSNASRGLRGARFARARLRGGSVRTALRPTDRPETGRQRSCRRCAAGLDQASGHDRCQPSRRTITIDGRWSLAAHRPAAARRPH